MIQSIVARLMRRSAVLALTVVCGMSAQAQVPSNAYSYTRTSSFTYYGSGDGTKNGLLKTETVEPGYAQLCATTTYSYDTYGNKTGASTANCTGATGNALFTSRGSTTAHAAVATQSITLAGGTQTPGSATVAVVAGSFVTTATNALSQSETHTVDPRFGATLTLTGPNTLSTTWTLDDFGRKVKELRADGTSTISYYCYIGGLNTTSNTYGCPTPAAGEAPTDAVMFVHSEPRDTSGTTKMGPFVRVYSDKLGRQLRSVTESFDGAGQATGKSGVLVAQDTVYNAYGAKIIQTQPYFLTAKSSTSGGTNDVGATLTNYDVLGRPTTVYTADPDGNQSSVAFGTYGNRKAALTQAQYTGLVTVTTNDQGQTRTEEKNAIGEVVRVTDNSGAQIAYQRDAFGNLETTKDALQNTVALTYDIRGRKVTMTDPDTGLWKYDYDALGELVWQQSPNERAATQTAAQQTTMSYDALGRMISRVDPEYTSTWSYDTYIGGGACAQGIGKLCETSTTNGVDRKIAYDAKGRPSNSRTTVTSGPTMGSTLLYDSVTGRLSGQVYPTGVQVGYAYTSRGYLEKLTLQTAATVAPLPSTPGGTPATGATLTAGTVLWTAQIVNAWGKAEQQKYYNNVVTQAGFEAATGRTSTLQAGTLGTTLSPTVLNYSYSWDSLNNLTDRTDAIGNGSGAVDESFTYGDSLNRLTQYQLSGPGIPGLSRTVNLEYNALGMLLYKSDVGNYTYPTQGASAVHPHALQSVAGTVTGSYVYDANGNQTTASGGKFTGIAYTSFNLPDSQNGVGGGPTRYTWQYDENHARVKEVRATSSGTYAGTVTTWNLHPDNQGGLGFESESNAPTSPSTANPAGTSNRHYLSVGGQAIGVLVTTGSLPTLAAWPATVTALSSGVTFVKMEYWHKDHLGSLVATSDHQGTVTQRYSFDPFGKRRYTSGSYDVSSALVYDWSGAVNYGGNRGYTGHEQLDDVGLVHMNGRVFNPTLGTFLQSDPMVQDPFNMQNYNRYGYCYNNPLICTDPSGLSFFGDLLKVAVVVFVAWEVPILATEFMTSIAGTTGTVFATAASGGSLTFAIPSTLTGLGSFTAAAAGGFAAGAIATGSLKGGLEGAFTAGSFALAGDMLTASGAFSGQTYYGENGAIGVTAHAVVGCITTVVGGGKCGAGALSAGLSQAALSFKSKDPNLAIAESMVVGGTGSVLGGGKFENGAETAAFGYIFNGFQHLVMGKIAQDVLYEEYLRERDFDTEYDVGDGRRADFRRFDLGVGDLKPATHLADAQALASDREQVDGYAAASGEGKIDWSSVFKASTISLSRTYFGVSVTFDYFAGPENSGLAFYTPMRSSTAPIYDWFRSMNRVPRSGSSSIDPPYGAPPVVPPVLPAIPLIVP